MEIDRMFSTLDIAGSALHAERMRMNVVANNLANANVTSKTGRPPSRQAVIFRSALNRAGAAGVRGAETLGGVRVVGVESVKSPPRRVYDPDHPHAGKDGYVAYPNISAFKEMANLISASRSYGANVVVAQSFKEMMTKTLSMGR